MNTLTIQPTLTPCNGSLDLISDLSQCGEFIELTWGTTLFMRQLDYFKVIWHIYGSIIICFGFFCIHFLRFSKLSCSV
jgi:hypothetical protein